jgi:hypothetical protein
LSIQLGIDIFASGENEAIGGFDDASRRARAGEGWNDHWYEPCHLEGSDVRGIEPDAMNSSEAGVGCRSDGNGVGRLSGGGAEGRIGHFMSER